MEDDTDYVEYVPVAKRRAMQAPNILQRKRKFSALEEEECLKLDDAKPSLLAKSMKREKPEISPTEKILQQ
jgi:ATP-dependent RNA helicase DDX41